MELELSLAGRELLLLLFQRVLPQAPILPYIHAYSLVQKRPALSSSTFLWTHLPRTLKSSKGLEQRSSRRRRRPKAPNGSPRVS